jgi:hypothetical protein
MPEVSVGYTKGPWGPFQQREPESGSSFGGDEHMVNSVADRASVAGYSAVTQKSKFGDRVSPCADPPYAFETVHNIATAIVLSAVIWAALIAALV